MDLIGFNPLVSLILSGGKPRKTVGKPIGKGWFDGSLCELSSGKLTHNHGTIHFFTRKTHELSMAIFYVANCNKLPEGNTHGTSIDFVFLFLGNAEEGRKAMQKSEGRNRWEKHLPNIENPQIRKR